MIFLCVCVCVMIFVFDAHIGRKRFDSDNIYCQYRRGRGGIRWYLYSRNRPPRPLHLEQNRSESLRGGSQIVRSLPQDADVWNPSSCTERGNASMKRSDAGGGGAIISRALQIQSLLIIRQSSAHDGDINYALLDVASCYSDIRQPIRITPAGARGSNETVRIRVGIVGFRYKAQLGSAVFLFRFYIKRSFTTRGFSAAKLTQRHPLLRYSASRFWLHLPAVVFARANRSHRRISDVNSRVLSNPLAVAFHDRFPVRPGRKSRSKQTVDHRHRFIPSDANGPNDATDI